MTSRSIKICVQRHHRHILPQSSVYSSSYKMSLSTSTDSEYFHKWKIEPSQIFFKSSHCYGLINLKPIVPGHILVVSRRVVARISDLTTEEAADLFGCVHKIVPVIEKKYGSSAMNIAVQDGAAAGQSVPHVHVHLLPRRPGDYERNDDVYEELEGHRADDTVLRPPPNEEDIGEGEGLRGGQGVDFKRERQPRSAKDMADESEALRAALGEAGVNFRC